MVGWSAERVYPLFFRTVFLYRDIDGGRFAKLILNNSEVVLIKVHRTFCWCLDSGMAGIENRVAFT